MNGKPKVILKDISKKYRLYENKTNRLFDALFPYQKRNVSDFPALDQISLTVEKGDVIGIVGRNGSGKSTLLKIIAGITIPSTGKVTVNGDVVPLLGLGTGFHPELSGTDNLYFYLVMMGYEKKEIFEIMKEAIDFVELGRFIHQPLKTYSKGMGARLSFAVNMFIDPDILLVDEALSAGDEYFKKKSIDKMQELFKSGRTIFYVSHNSNDITELCNRAIMLHNGKKLAEGTPRDVLKEYRNFFKHA